MSDTPKDSSYIKAAASKLRDEVPSSAEEIKQLAADLLEFLRHAPEWTEEDNLVEIRRILCHLTIAIGKGKKLTGFKLRRDDIIAAWFEYSGSVQYMSAKRVPLDLPTFRRAMGGVIDFGDDSDDDEDASGGGVDNAARRGTMEKGSNLSKDADKGKGKARVGKDRVNAGGSKSGGPEKADQGKHLAKETPRLEYQASGADSKGKGTAKPSVRAEPVRDRENADKAAAKVLARAGPADHGENKGHTATKPSARADSAGMTNGRVDGKRLVGEQAGGASNQVLSSVSASDDQARDASGRGGDSDAYVDEGSVDQDSSAKDSKTRRQATNPRKRKKKVEQGSETEGGVGDQPGIYKPACERCTGEGATECPYSIKGNACKRCERAKLGCSLATGRRLKKSRKTRPAPDTVIPASNSSHEAAEQPVLVQVGVDDGKRQKEQSNASEPTTRTTNPAGDSAITSKEKEAGPTRKKEKAKPSTSSTKPAAVPPSRPAKAQKSQPGSGKKDQEQKHNDSNVMDIVINSEVRPEPQPIYNLQGQKMGQIVTGNASPSELIIPPPTSGAPTGLASALGLLRERVSTLESLIADCQGQSAAFARELQDHTSIRHSVRRLNHWKSWMKDWSSDIDKDYGSLEDSLDQNKDLLKQVISEAKEVDKRLSDVERQQQEVTRIWSQSRDVNEAMTVDQQSGINHKLSEVDDALATVERLEELQKAFITEVKERDAKLQDETSVRIDHLEGLVHAVTRRPTSEESLSGQSILGRLSSLEILAGKVLSAMEGAQSGQDVLKRRLDGMESDLRQVLSGVAGHATALSDSQRKVLDGLHDQSRSLRQELDLQIRSLRVSVASSNSVGLMGGWDDTSYPSSGNGSWLGTSESRGNQMQNPTAAPFFGETMGLNPSAGSTFINDNQNLLPFHGQAHPHAHDGQSSAQPSSSTVSLSSDSHLQIDRRDSQMQIRSASGASGSCLPADLAMEFSQASAAFQTQAHQLAGTGCPNLGTMAGSTLVAGQVNSAVNPPDAASKNPKGKAQDALSHSHSFSSASTPFIADSPLTPVPSSKPTTPEFSPDNPDNL